MSLHSFYGFNSKENFMRAFKREHHILPTEYRSAENSLKLYEKYRLIELSTLYERVFKCWQKAFNLEKSRDMSLADNRNAIADLMKEAEECERKAIDMM